MFCVRINSHQSKLFLVKLVLAIMLIVQILNHIITYHDHEHKLIQALIGHAWM